MGLAKQTLLGTWTNDQMTGNKAQTSFIWTEFDWPGAGKVLAKCRG